MEEISIPTLSEDQELPHYASEEAAGADIRAFINEPMVIAAGKSALIPTGLRFQIPKGYEIQIRPRSGLALKNQVTVLNSPGTIDADYRGEVKIILINHGLEDFVVLPKMRIAQMVVAPVVHAQFFVVNDLETSCRGAGGFGHTGMH